MATPLVAAAAVEAVRIVAEGASNPKDFLHNLDVVAIYAGPRLRGTRWTTARHLRRISPRNQPGRNRPCLTVTDAENSELGGLKSILEPLGDRIQELRATETRRNSTSTALGGTLEMGLGGQGVSDSGVGACHHAAIIGCRRSKLARLNSGRSTPPSSFARHITSVSSDHAA
jgi:hypothetical protein